MSAALVEGTAEAIAAAVRSGAVSAREIAQETSESHRSPKWGARRLHRGDREARARQG